jgi:hypothetical protein
MCTTPGFIDLTLGKNEASVTCAHVEFMRRKKRKNI